MAPGVGISSSSILSLHFLPYFPKQNEYQNQRTLTEHAGLKKTFPNNTTRKTPPLEIKASKLKFFDDKVLMERRTDVRNGLADI